MDRIQYGAHLRSLRISQGKGKEEVAQAMGIPVELLEAWEDGVRLPTEQQLQVLSAALQVTFDQVCPPGAPRQKRGLSHSQIALIIAGGIFALAMTIWSMRTSLEMTDSMESRAETMMEEMMISFLQKDESIIALDYIASSALFQQLGLEEADLALAAYDNHYRYGSSGLILETELEFSAGEYLFQVTCQQLDGQWQVTKASAVVPLDHPLVPQATIL